MKYFVFALFLLIGSTLVHGQSTESTSTVAPSSTTTAPAASTSTAASSSTEAASSTTAAAGSTTTAASTSTGAAGSSTTADPAGGSAHGLQLPVHLLIAGTVGIFLKFTNAV
ncbi:protein new-glue 3 [Uranotaenia lowii]|uniref:protein new-glue 3 n=1 Tax=Uranotaenia lowii TaxID=190385 RepID=UPI0024793BBD|nr:protein new-glue 3 [Uranotaenia lowii]